MIDQFMYLVCVFAFLAVSLSLAAKFITEAYLEYIQVKTGIRVITEQQMAEMEEEDEFDESNR